MMRILLVSQEMPPETGWGGIGTYADVLSEALARLGHEVHVLSVVDGQAASSRAREDGVVVHRRRLGAPPIRGTGRLPPEAWRRSWLAVNVARCVTRLGLRPDVVECPEWMAEGLGLGLASGTPLVVRLHSAARQLFPFTGQGRSWRGLDARLAFWLEETSARRANAVISTGSNLAEVAGWMRLDPAALHAIPYPVRLPPPAPMPEGAAPRVIFVGRLEPRKGPETLLRAVPEVLRRAPNASFAFVGRDVMAAGEMPSSQWLRREAERMGVSEAVELTGPRDRAGVLEELRRASVCAFPSRWESFGNVVAEAAAVGRPVVASDIPPFRELVSHGVTGLIAPTGEPGAWATAISRLLCDPREAERMGRAGAERIARISLPERVAGLTLDAYAAAIERARRGRRAGRPLISTRLPRVADRSGAGSPW